MAIDNEFSSGFGQVGDSRRLDGEESSIRRAGGAHGLDGADKLDGSGVLSPKPAKHIQGGNPTPWPIIKIPVENNEGAAQAVCELGAVVGGKLVPGWFSGGHLSKLIDHPDDIEAAANKKVWLKVTWTADKVDEVLQAGGTAGTVEVETGPTVTVDKVPIITDLAGIAYIPLGGWDGDGNWVKSGCGTVTLGFCPGGFIKSR